MIKTYQNAKDKLLTADIEGCQQFFKNNGYELEHGYSELLNDNLQKAECIFSSIAHKDIRAHWALVLLSFIEGKVSDYPSYFEIRNFLEIDLNILITYYKGEYVEKIIRYADYMFTINPEVYKFIGRVFWNNDLKEQSLFFLNQAKNYFYQDPELHYLLGVVYLDRKDYSNTFKALNDCLSVLPDYYPAVDLLNKLKKSKL